MQIINQIISIEIITNNQQIITNNQQIIANNQQIITIIKI